MKDFIFDVDGVLLDSIDIGIHSLIEAAKRSRVKLPTVNMIKQLWGHGLETSLVPILADSLKWPLEKDQEVIQFFYEISHTQKYPIKKGLAETLEELSTTRCKLGIVSNRDMSSLEYRFREQNIDLSIFSHIHTPDKGARKPNPAVFNHFWNGAGFTPKNTVFIGDSIEHDLAVARAHQPQLCFVAITSGLHSISDFIKAGVKSRHIFSKVEDVFRASYIK